MQDFPDTMSLTFAHDHLRSVTQRDQPALAAHRAHLPHMVHVDDRVAVDAIKVLVLQAIFNTPQVLCRQQTLL